LAYSRVDVAECIEIASIKTNIPKFTAYTANKRDS